MLLAKRVAADESNPVQHQVFWLLEGSRDEPVHRAIRLARGWGCRSRGAFRDGRCFAASGVSGVGGQPGDEVVRALKVDQGVREGFQLPQGQRLDGRRWLR
jgi:hypothetical protein